MEDYNKKNKQKKKFLSNIENESYKYGFSTDIENDQFNPGLNEEIIRLISEKKSEPNWLFDFRLKAFRYWKNLNLKKLQPKWANIIYPEIDFNNIIYYSAPKHNDNRLDEKILDTYDKLGIPILQDNKDSNIAVDAIFDSVSVVTTFKDKLHKLGIIFCSFSEAVNKYPEIIKKYLGSVVHYNDNYFASLNSAVFSDGSFCFIPKNVSCPMELSTYFRINASNIGQFERTLIIAEDNSYVSYLEGCSAPMRSENQLHAAVVELVALNNAKIKYSTVQNWYPGDKKGNGGILNFVTKRGICSGDNSKISWTQIETGSSITWKYPSCILKGNNSVGEFHSIAVTNNMQQADTGTKMIHLGENTSSTIISKGISFGKSQNSYRGLVKIKKNAKNSRNYSQCDSLIFGSTCGAHTFPLIEVENNSSQVEHEASTSKIRDEQLFYCQQRGISMENAISMIINGFCKSVFNRLPMEFAVEAKKLINMNIVDLAE